MSARFFPLLALLLLSACAPEVTVTNTGPFTEGDAPGRVALYSEPEGALIQVNGHGVGRTPCTADLPVMQVGGRTVLRDHATIVALPERKDELPQTRTYDQYTEPPRRLRFVMLNNEKPSHD